MKALLIYAITNFGPLLAFYLVNNVFGLKAAISASLLVIVLEVVHFRIKKEKLSAFFLFSSTIAILFGIVDLTMSNPTMFKYEAGTINILFAAFFLGSLLKEKSIVQEIAEQQGRTQKNTSIDKSFFFKILTAIWSAYFLLKAICYTWINLNNSLEYGMVLRFLIGNISLTVMIFLSVYTARSFWRLLEKFKLLPSLRQNTKDTKPAAL